MSDLSSYVGLTVGPIFDTIDDATTPASLWFASSIFSDLTRRLCEGLHDTLPDCRIYTPFYTPESGERDSGMEEGVGKYHDRIILGTSMAEGDELDTRLRDIVAKAKADTAGSFPEQMPGYEAIASYLMRYLRIHYVTLSATRTDWFAAINHSMNCLELMNEFPSQTDASCDPFRCLFAGRPESHNAFVKGSSLFRHMGGDKNPMLDERGAIRDIRSIASAGGERGLKKYRYFAVVNADGDNMGKLLGGLMPDQLRACSGRLMDYAGTAAREINKFGGMVIYAGGDDLLFLAPVENAKGEDVMSLCHRIAEQFSRSMEDALRDIGLTATAKPTLSFGISIQYEKYPLYQALKRSRDMLASAKEDGGGHADDYRPHKDNIAVHLSKHSGQSSELLVPNAGMDAFRRIFSPAPEQDAAESFQTVARTLRMFKKELAPLHRAARAGAITADQYACAWTNFFDNAGQADLDAYVDSLAHAYYEDFLVGDADIRVPGGSEGAERDGMDSLVSLLLLRRFMVEPASPEEVDG